MSVTLTEKAASEVKKIITDQKLEDGTVLRVGVAGVAVVGFNIRSVLTPNSIQKLIQKLTSTAFQL